MKSKLLIVMVTTGIASLSTGFIGNVSNFSSTPLRVENTMGRGPNCLGRGICNITTEKPHSKSSSADFSSEIHINEDGRLIMKIGLEELSAELIQEQFQDNQLILTEDFELPADLLNGMEIKSQHLTIPPGTYPVEITKTEIIITFDLQSH